jgi:hypothetical protein
MHIINYQPGISKSPAEQIIIFTTSLINQQPENVRYSQQLTTYQHIILANQESSTSQVMTLINAISVQLLG